MISADIKTDVKQRNKRTGSCILSLFTYVPSQNLQYNVKQACIFHLILVDILFGLRLSVKNREGKGFFTLQPKSFKSEESYLFRIP